MEVNLKWHEEVFEGILAGLLSLTFFFDGFSYLTSLFVKDGQILNGPTKQKGLIALISLIERGWWNYPFSIVFGILSFYLINKGIKKCRNKKNP